MAPRLLNLTPHACHLYLPDGSVTTIAPYVAPGADKAEEARVPTERRFLGWRGVTAESTVGELRIEPADAAGVAALPVGAIALYTPQVPTGAPNLPSRDEDDGETAILVSYMVGEFCAAHQDSWRGPVYGPDTAPGCAVRSTDEKNKGQIIGVRGLTLFKSANECTH